jgi:hypothetical protein
MEREIASWEDSYRMTVLLFMQIYELNVVVLINEEYGEQLFTIHPARRCHAPGALVNGGYDIRATA